MKESCVTTLIPLKHALNINKLRELGVKLYQAFSAENNWWERKGGARCDFSPMNKGSRCTGLGASISDEATSYF